MRKINIVFYSACLLFVSGTTFADTAGQILDECGIAGGLVVHVGCGDGALTAQLGDRDGFLVQGLDVDENNVRIARRYIQSSGLYGKVTIEPLRGDYLPYIDNLVTLVVSEDLGRISTGEVMRVLAPGGVAYIKHGAKWTKTVKPRPANIDEWTHFLHGPDGNAVAKDSVVGPPRHMQFKAAPNWTRNHHTLASVSAVVSAAGRIFSILDIAPAASTQLPANWSLVARDAFNGVLLWKKPVPSWAWHLRKFRSGPVQLPRTLVAEGDRVYVPLGVSEPVSILDAKTGDFLAYCQGTDAAEEIILDNGILFIVTGTPISEQTPEVSADSKQIYTFENTKSIVAVNADTGKKLWKWTVPNGQIMPLTLTAQDGRVFFNEGNNIICLSAKTGKRLWSQSPDDFKVLKNRKPGWSVHTMVVHDAVVLWADGKLLRALSAKDGKPLWQCQLSQGFNSPPDVFVIDGLVWSGSGFAEARDLKSGKIVKTNSILEQLRTAGHHHRCYREKATERYILSNHRGIEFLDLQSGDHSRNNWIRGLCQYGIMPSNGLVYAPPHSCGCFMEAKLYGFWALAPQRDSLAADPQNQRLQKGPAYQKIVNSKSKIVNRNAWPMQRGSVSRSGATSTKLPTRLKHSFTADIGGRLTPPVISQGTVVVSSIDDHRIVAIGAETGKTKWTYIAGGRVDSAPTLYRNMALFGCADGSVYCLRLSDGKLIWRFQAAPTRLSTVALDQIESVWPVHGSVLVQNDTVYFAAGRSSYLDGGIYLYGLDPATGKVIVKSRIDSEHPGLGEENNTGIEWQQIVQNATDYKTFTAVDRSDAFSMEGATTDIFVGDGSDVYMRHLKFDRNLKRLDDVDPHLLSTSSLLDDAENHRSHWVFGPGDFSRTPVAYSWIMNKDSGWQGTFPVYPRGMLLTFDDKDIWSVRRVRDGGYTLISQTRRSVEEFAKSDEPDFRVIDKDAATNYTWSKPLPMRPRAMINAGRRLYIAGMPSEYGKDNWQESFDGSRGGLIKILSAEDGTEIAQYKLDSAPVWDAIAAANEKIYISTIDGNVICLN